VLGDKFEMVTAFSREGSKKVYVQHRLKERAKEVNELLQQKAYFYVCGDAANMAREVNAVLAQILCGERGIPEEKAEEIVKQMRATNQYQVRFKFCHLSQLGLLTVKLGGRLVLDEYAYQRDLCYCVNGDGAKVRTALAIHHPACFWDRWEFCSCCIGFAVGRFFRIMCLFSFLYTLSGSASPLRGRMCF
jgi:hypothetical protein